MAGKYISHEDFKALGIKKGDKVRFGNVASEARISVGVVEKISCKKGKYPKYFDGAIGRWVDGKEFKYVELTFKVEGAKWLIAEDTFAVLEKVEEEVTDVPLSDIWVEELIGLTPEEMMFMWDRDDLYDFAKMFGIPNRSKMNKAQLAMAIENEVSVQ